MDTNDKSKEMRELDLKELWNLFLRRLWVMILAAVVCIAGAVTLDRMSYKPVYTSTATLYILHQEDKGNVQANYNFALALNVVNDCDYLLKSHAVLDEVIDTLSLNQSYGKLRRCVFTNNPEDTRILEVTVQADTPEEAKQIVDVLCEIGQDKISEAMGFDQVNLYEYGTLNRTPSNGIGLKKYLTVGLISAALVYAIFVVIYLLDDRIRTDEDIEKRLGLTILGEIPDGNSTAKGKYGYYKSYGHKPANKRKGS